MEIHKCKLCSRSFSNGRALGGHMKAHLATLPIPPKPQTFQHPFESASFSYQSQPSQEEEQHVVESHEKAMSYGLRGNPKRSLRYSYPEFSFNNNGFVAQDRESESESKKPTGQRSKRNRKSRLYKGLEQEPKMFKPSFLESPPLSSVSDFSPEEDVAMCLMMLSRDKWESNLVFEGEGNQVTEAEEEIKLKKRIGVKNECENCGKKFRSFRALGSHRSICCSDKRSDKIFECPFCFKVFGSGQALGGHKRSHLMQNSSSTSIANSKKESFLDLNLPAPIEGEDDLSIVSDVSNA
ncbi:hypothetical protein TanjilG_23718 [Lupinus angustifolius]|uniref:C2H2-type domain-containing protein n=1 Tax=Lupinus angustifolius TaxID=3871 RepID=A0A1J7GGW5_LUPAN|nr:PREDICTED: zinc finger protein ZAT9-like [Lupinus angustifolius]OIV89304.1 hypothetical protein TanjilG_23718 [Lupinus angustifolius]